MKIRDGDSLASELIFDYIGGYDKATKKTVIMSSESQTLIEFYSNELSMIDDSCKGGFLTHAHQIRKNVFKINVFFRFFLFNNFNFIAQMKNMIKQICRYQSLAKQ